MKYFTSLALIIAFSFGVAPKSQGAEATIQGIVISEDETTLSSEMAGRIKTFSKDEGDTFKKGERIVGFACDILYAERSFVVASVKGAKATFDNAKRLDILGAAGTLDLALADADLEERRAKLRVADAKAALCSVHAPFDGVVLSREVERYESVNVMEPLLKIARTGTLRIAVIAPAHWLGWVRKGARFKFTPRGGKVASPGQIDKIGVTVDAASQTVKIEGVLDDRSAELIAGVGGTVSFTVPKAGVK